MKGYVYQIKCVDENITDCYIGSTINLESRKKYHKSVWKNPDNKAYNYRIYQFIRNNGGFDNFIFEVIKEVEVPNKKDLKQFEWEEYNIRKPTLNCNIPLIQTDMIQYQKEYYAEKYKDYHKKRYQENKELYKTRNKLRYAMLKTMAERYLNNEP